MPRVRTTRRTQQETSQEFSPVGNESGVAFSNGVMHVNGTPQRPELVEHWESSNGLSTYTTVTWVDPGTGTKRTSCNCPGWAHKRGNTRGCCHTKDMEGTKPCPRKKVERIDIQTVEQAVEEIPDVRNGRELRGIMLD